MKRILKAIAIEPRAIIAAIIMLSITVAYGTINVVVLNRIAGVFDDLTNAAANVGVLLGLCAINTALDITKAMLRHYMQARCFTTLCDRFTRILGGSDYTLHAKYSNASLTTTREYLGQVVTVGCYIVEFTILVGNICITIGAIAVIGRWAVIPIIGVYALGGLLMKRLFHAMTLNSKENNKRYKARNQVLDDLITGFAEILIAGQTDTYVKNVCDQNNEIFELSAIRRNHKGIVNGAFEILDTIGMLTVIIYAIAGIRAGTMTAAVAVTLVMYVWRLSEPIASLIDITEKYADSKSKADEFLDFVEDAKTHQDADGSLELTSFNRKIEIQDVTYSYDTDNTVLDGVSVEITKGSKIGICGASGGGKSTLFRLLLRLIRPTTGCITIDGIDINLFTRNSIARHVSAVFQDTVILPGTILENIRFGSKATEADVIAAAEKAGLSEFVASLPMRFETEVGPRGMKLSGGQRQKIALARTFLSNTDIVLLDEATSALDNNSETLIQNAIEEFGPDKTVITIAHRLSTIRNCDKILVVDDRKIVEAGTHDELMALNGIYAKMQK